MVNHMAAALLFAILHLTVAPSANAVLMLWVHNCSTADGNYTNNNIYKTNLDSLFTKTTTTNLDYGFYNFTTGKSPDIANLVSLCLGNIDVAGCHTCQKFVINSMNTLCPNQKTAIAWSDDCMVRYSSQSIFGVLAEDPGFEMPRGLLASNETLEKYSSVASTLLESLPSKASAGDSSLKFAAGQADFNSSITIFAAAQCTPDLSQKDCLDCLNDANSKIQSCCKGQRGARVLLPSCMVRYEEGKFYLDAPISSTSPSPTVAVSPSAVAPTSNSTGNAAKERIVGKSSFLATAVVGAYFSALL